jgi:SSS family solute:Na+ symporter
MAGKMLAIPFEMLLVWLVIIPFLTRFRYTSAYDYLGERFGGSAKWVGIGLFLWLAVSWMGFIVLVSSRIMADASEVDLYLTVAVTGVVATVYTVTGGLRAVIWTDVVQVVLMLGGAIMTMAVVAWETGSTPADWYEAIAQPEATGHLKWFSLDPFERSTILTIALSMFTWHVCTHTGNQMTVQRYFSAGTLQAARKSFLVGSLTGVLINLLLLGVGLALFYYYGRLSESMPEGIDPRSNQADHIFPRFAMHRLPAGLAGAWLAAMLAAAMSSIDSGINSAASVLTVALGLSITAAAYGLDKLTAGRNIIEMMSRSFNCFTGPLGGMFMLGMFAPRVGNRAATAAALVGVSTSISLAYGDKLYGLSKAPSFAWVQPGSLVVTMVAGLLLMSLDPRRVLRGELTWFGGQKAE